MYLLIIEEIEIYNTSRNSYTTGVPVYQVYPIDNMAGIPWYT